MGSDGPVYGQKALGMTCRFEPPHGPLPLACRLMRIFRTIIEMAVLAAALVIVTFTSMGNSLGSPCVYPPEPPPERAEA